MLLRIRPHDAMDDWDIFFSDVIHHDLTHFRARAAIPQEQEIASLESRLHTAGQHHDNWRRCARDDTEGFPDHESGRENK